MKKSLRGVPILRYLLLTIGAIIMVIPMIYMVTSSFRPNKMTFTYPPQIFPDFSQLSLANYQYVLIRQDFFKYLLNTLFVAVVSSAMGAVFIDLGYCISRFGFKGRNLLYGTIITIMLIPGLTMLDRNLALLPLNL